MLKIHKGGKLLETYWDGKTKEYKQRDVTESAVTLLFEPCDLAEDVALKDIFLLLNTELKLFDLILTNWCEEIVTEGLSSEGKPYTGEYNKEEIEYLELYFIAEQEVLNKEYTFHGFSRPDFHGIGFELREDYVNAWGDKEWGKGGRIPWSVSFIDVKNLVNLPVKLNKNTSIYLADYDSTDKSRKGLDLAHRKLLEVSGVVYTLGQILNGIIWELSFYGSPEDTKGKKLELDGIIKDLEKSTKHGKESH